MPCERYILYANKDFDVLARCGLNKKNNGEVFRTERICHSDCNAGDDPVLPKMGTIFFLREAAQRFGRTCSIHPE